MKKIYHFLLACLLAASVTLPAHADGTINVADGQGDGSGWTFANNAITIEQDGVYTFIGTTTENSIIVKSGLKEVFVTLKNVSITTNQPFYITPTNTVVNITLEGVNTLTSTSSGAGKAGLSAHSGTTLNIYGDGSLTATGGNQGAGIGSASSIGAGKINVYSGVVTGISLDKAAGIGAGYHGSGGQLTVYGGIVTGIANGAGDGIGNYNPTSSSFMLYLSGDGIVSASSVRDANLEHRTNGILFSGNEGVFYGTSVTASNNFSITSDRTLTIGEGQTLTIPAGTTLLSEGNLIVEGALNVEGELITSKTFTVIGDVVLNGSAETSGTLTIYGSFTNNGTLVNKGVIDGVINGNPISIEEYAIDLSTVSASGDGYTFADGLLTLNKPDAYYTLTGSTESVRVAVTQGISVNVIFNNISITATENAFHIPMNSTAKISLEGVNYLTGKAGLGVLNGATTIIEGDGSLFATGRQGAGIGAAAFSTAGTINITDGYITATSGSAAGIGGSSATISISGGLVKATTSGIAKPGIGGTTAITGNAVVLASSISDNTAKAGGLVFKGNVGNINGTSVAPDKDFTIEAGQTLTVDGGKTLKIPAGVTVTNNGTINIYGKLDIAGSLINDGNIVDFGEVTGSVTGNAITKGEGSAYNIDLATVSESTAGYTVAGNVITLNENNAVYTITGTGAKTIVVEQGLFVKVILHDAKISSSKAFFINASATADITLEGDNELNTISEGNAGLGVTKGGKVIIGGTGSLIATGWGNASAGGAGIGGTGTVKGGTIIINSGDITAIGNRKAAGIGGGYHTGYEAIEINGGFVTATGAFWAATQGDGIGGYDNSSDCGPFTMNGNAIVIASSVRENSPKTSGLLFDNNNVNYYGKGVVIDHNITFPDGTLFTIKPGQTLTLNEGDTITLPTSSVFNIGVGSTLVNNGVVKAYQESSIVTNGTINGTGKILIEKVDYDNRDRLYFSFHTLANLLYDNSVRRTMTQSEIDGIHAAIPVFEAFLEKHSPNVNVVSIIDDHMEETKAQGTGNNNYFIGTVPLDAHSMDIMIAKPTGSPSYAAYYCGSCDSQPYIHLMPGWASPVLMHEFAHHITNYNGWNPDDGQPWEHLYLRYDTMLVQQWTALIEDCGEHWNGDNEWLYPDDKTQIKPDVIFPEFAKLTFGQKLSAATFSGQEGQGTFAFSNGDYDPKDYENGRSFKMVFTPTDQNTYHVVTKDILVKYNGIKLDATLTLEQPDIVWPETPNPIIGVAPTYISYTVEYKLQGASNDAFSTVVPTEPGKYTVRVTFAGDDELNPARELVNFVILQPTGVAKVKNDDRTTITSGEGFIRIDVNNGRKNSLLRVYTIAGSLVTSKYIAPGETFISAPRGLYIVNCEGARKKVIVR
jgi:hypothetical protein